METAAFTHGVQDVLQGDFIPPVGDADAHALFCFQNVFMYSVFKAKIKTNKGMSIVRSHENNRNAHAIWKELVAHQTTSTTGKWNRQHLLTFLQTFKLDGVSWQGSHTGFLAHYKDKPTCFGGNYLWEGSSTFFYCDVVWETQNPPIATVLN
jgi:hypothetical protein